MEVPFSWVHTTHLQTYNIFKEKERENSGINWSANSFTIEDNILQVVSELKYQGRVLNKSYNYWL